MVRTSLTALAAALCVSTAALADTPQGAADRLGEFLAAIPDLGPGYAAVVVTADDVLLNYVSGVERASTGVPLTADTPLYIASQTKAYMGLVAAVLDEQGVLSLDSTIADHWPDLALPGDLDPSAWTMRDLLSHQVPLDVDAITFLEAYVTRVDPADYPALISAMGEVREEGFEYANIGYNIYGAILETVTGKTWQDWLDEVIIEPMGWEHTSARTSDFGLDGQSWNHILAESGEGWQEVRPKTDAIMQSAGGMVTSVNDMAGWLQMQLRGEGPGLISASAIAEAQEGHVETGMEDRRNAYEQVCSHYSLGWNICEKNGHNLYIHGGGYTGAATMMAFSPDLGIGIAAFSNSNAMTGWATSRTVDMYLQFLTDDPNAERMRELRINHYPERVDRLRQIFASRAEEAQADEQWGGWTWSPSAEELEAYSGRFVNENSAYFTVNTYVEEGVLRGWVGDYPVYLTPASENLFAARNVHYDRPDPVRFIREDDGTVSGFVWDGQTYNRVD
ncbi:serine hydrolase domain-containing protein [Maricaulis sp.]|uniref:serine hydrolase domain-containing protein n=1 Tax=Maricaulis sp. TaxID=1486257 RepID=UPI002616FCCF|nr:serine hydrolase domain-containing protein [Maricaulis sp.]